MSGDALRGLRLEGHEPLYLQLRERLREAILQRRLPAGARLPSTRELAASVNVSRNTVLLAYELLIADGLAEARRGSGTYVLSESRRPRQARRRDGERRR